MSTPSDYPSWVIQNPTRYINRLKHEARELYQKFPHIGIYRRGGVLYLEGPVVTMSKNQYTVRVIYPDTYPFHKPEAYILDKDVIQYCSASGRAGHSYHNYGQKQDGLHLCIMGATDTVNKGWTPNQTGITILEYAIMWLHGYEFKKVRNYWPLPE